MILLLDNYDSFTYNIVQALGTLGQGVTVVRSDEIGPSDVESFAPDAIVISPGPGRPSDAGVSCRIIESFAGRIPILGVCLGHQCIAEVFGARVVRARTPVHGKISEVFHDDRTIFAGVRNPFRATRYHSLIAAEESISSPLEVSAYTMEGETMCHSSGCDAHPEFPQLLSGHGPAARCEKRSRVISSIAGRCDMVILMKEQSRKKEVGGVLAAIRQRGLAPRIISASPRVVVGIVEDMDEQAVKDLRQSLTPLKCVERIETFGTSWKPPSG
ncbi:MAG: hypothetical protein P8182_16050 [Deltaproteobacteria bacterium]